MYTLTKVNENMREHFDKYYGFDYHNAYIIEKDNVLYGMISYEEFDESERYFEGSGSFYRINYIEIEPMYRRKGIGSAVIKQFKKDLIGNSSIKYIDFWISLGARIEDDIDECIRNDETIPFIIFK